MNPLSHALRRLFSFRSQRPNSSESDCTSLGRVDELRKCSKGGPDPDGLGSRVTPTDVLWGDPAPTNGLAYNESRGVGLLFGPDFTEAFLRRFMRWRLRSNTGSCAVTAEYVIACPDSSTKPVGRATFIA